MRRPPQVDSIDEAGYLVCRVADVDEARRLAVEWVARNETHGDQREAEAVVDWLVPDTGWWRKAPCYCGGEHKWDMMPAGPNARGAFEGVFFTNEPVRRRA